MKKKIGRNEPCPCGAKKPDGTPLKYKRCHLGKPFGISQPELAEAFKKIQDDQIRRREYLHSFGIYIDFVQPIQFQGKKVWALGNRIYAVSAPHQTFHEFIVYTVLRHELGDDWLQSEFKKPEENMHFIARCCIKFDEFNARASRDSTFRVGENLWRANADGWTLSLLSLAFDIASLAHSAPVRSGQAEGLKKLIERLKDKDAYQGARYEITVAAIFARMGFVLEYYDDQNTKYKHGEFIATHPLSRFRLVVEAKSRHRTGVLHQPGLIDEKEHLKGDVRPLLNRAIAKETDGLPLLIFIDVNSPSTGKETMDEKWSRDIVKSLGKDPMPTPENPDPYSGICFTNYSYHYQTENEAAAGQNLMIIPLHPKIRIQDPALFQDIQSALNKYGNVPLIDMAVDPPPDQPNTESANES